MAQIFQFPKKHRIHARHAQASVENDVNSSWHALLDNPIVSVLGCLLMTLVLCTWPILRWIIAADLLIQLFRLFFISGWAAFGALIHLLVVGVAVYLLLRAPTRPRR